MKSFIREIKGNIRQKTITIPKEVDGKIGETVAVFPLQTIINIVMELKEMGEKDLEDAIKKLSIWDTEG